MSAAKSVHRYRARCITRGVLQHWLRRRKSRSSPRWRLVIGDAYPFLHELGFDRLHAMFRRTHYTAAVGQTISVMAFKRLRDADSKPNSMRWLHTVRLPNGDAAETTRQRLLRSRHALMDHQAAVEDGLARLLRPHTDKQLSRVTHHLTTLRVEGAERAER